MTSPFPRIHCVAGTDGSTQTHCSCPLLCPTPNTAPEPWWLGSYTPLNRSVLKPEAHSTHTSEVPEKMEKPLKFLLESAAR